jgi:trans-aconitate 2-methyltransferase
MTTSSWDPAQYQRYADERARPFFDLIARVRTASPSTVVDLGCGPGPMTAALAERWPHAYVLGLDSSPDMIDAASAHTRPGHLEFRRLAIEEWEPVPVDVVVSNAALQWVPAHPALLPRWTSALRPGGAIAIQMPRTSAMPVGEIFTRIATSPRWRGLLGAVAGTGGPRSLSGSVRGVTGYVDQLARLGLSVDAWETTYVHVLPGADPVLEWFSGTGLRPYLDALAGEPGALADFRAEVAARLREAYPPQPYGTLLPFPRIFVVAHRA